MSFFTSHFSDRKRFNLKFCIKTSLIFFFLINQFLILYDNTLPVSFLAIAAIISQLLSFSIIFSVLVAFTDLLLSIFHHHGTVALCHCLKRTETFGTWRVCGHAAVAHGGTGRWWRGGETRHATQAPRPSRKGRSLPWRKVRQKCFFRHGRFYGWIINDIYWVRCATYVHITAEKTNRTYTNTEKYKREEKMKYIAVTITDDIDILAKKTCK